MHQNDGVSFTSSPLKIPLSQTPAFQLTETRHLAFQLIDSLRNRFNNVKHHSTQFNVSAQSELGVRSSTRRSPLLCFASVSLAAEKQSIGRSPLLYSAFLSLTQPDSTESTQDGHLATAGPFGEERVLVGEVLVRNKDGEELERKDLEMEALNALKACGANSALTAWEVQEDVDRIIDSGYFSSCTPVAVDSRDGIRLVFQVEPNQELRGLVCEGANVLPSKFLENAFRDGHGKVVNLKRLDQVISSINGWYMDRGIFGLVSGVDIFSGGIVRLKVAESEVNDISVRFLDRKTGEPTKGKTKPATILSQLTTKKGQVYSRLQGKRDVDAISAMSLMDVSILPQSAGDAGKVDLIMNVVERPSGRFSAGAGISSGITSDLLSGLFGSFAYSERNLFGKNQKLNVSLERGQIDSTFRINYTDPWIEGNDKQTSRTITVQNSRSSGTLVHGNQHDNSSLSIGRVTAGVEFSRPLRPKWSGTAGLFFQRAGAHDEKKNPLIKDFYGSPLTASGKLYDDMLLAKVECVYPGSGNKGSSMFIINMEQGLPVMPDWLYFNRVNTRVSKSVKLGPARLLLRLSGGHVVGNFPPHEAFAIGGTNSVRGYKEGAVGSGQSYVVGSSEVSLKMLGPVEGVIFADYGHDLWSGPNVPGNPAAARNKRGSGYGYGIGIRLNSPLGLLRLEYAFNDRFAKRLHFAFGNPK
ncbi:Outer envelope 80, chloroplastic -like protein [Gossypium arboreum]|uniref:Outer envelope 80, chloroplastic-like protein n=1 Tax=Gossypium arboreum TaxID=29729 RepID=A0A0B0NPC5_GOSAR|nr:outer envelope protein 80, chloroplastic-like [Gossypium arboreum]KHG12926.1 Outer envelope 80, chloroplastic -like protein [Gossypium arboreum]